MTRPKYQTVIENLALLSRLQEFHPMVIGTPPLGLETETSDLDIACYAKDLDQFMQLAASEFGDYPSLNIRCGNIHPDLTVCVEFQSCDWTIELFCQSVPIHQQWGVRHYWMEHRLLNLEPQLRPIIQHLKRVGYKTEPAFALMLGLEGDPYRAMLALGMRSDTELAHLISSGLETHVIFPESCVDQ